ncbi:DUF1572 family protein [Yeosuana sp. MJ-SS3]|uniref:DUF1572 family protein n=1 Tax=Gilvirhabdus luticola TaxID=3079858 RepID=A0ABU3UA34_9FLAO|nr:DUF1572 family protein [Yeosuana sp. MJ-SS3]MDU8887268.1 DUF1572 family protein [Yeosuana sp. MJ-SS3]
MNSYLNSVINRFETYKTLGEKTFKQLTFEEMQWQSDEDSNSISIIVKHIVGNMLSRWTNFLTEDGEKEWRHRDQEFIDTYTTNEEMMASWESGWNVLFNAIKPLTVDDLERKVYIRDEEHSVIDAINRQLAHYAYHIGQIVFIGKLIKGDSWKSLSIPKGKSSEFNAGKFKN